MSVVGGGGGGQQAKIRKADFLVITCTAHERYDSHKQISILHFTVVYVLFCYLTKGLTPKKFHVVWCHIK